MQAISGKYTQMKNVQGEHGIHGEAKASERYDARLECSRKVIIEVTNMNKKLCDDLFRVAMKDIYRRKGK